MTPPQRPPDSRSTPKPSDPEVLADASASEAFWRKQLAPADPLYEERLEFLTEYTDRVVPSIRNHLFAWDNPSSYSLESSLQYSFRNISNGTGLDYQGPGGKIAGGLRLNFGRYDLHSAYVRPFYQFQHLQSAGADPIENHAVGLEGASLFGLVPDWLHVGPRLGLAWTYYDSAGPLAFAKGPLPDGLNASGMRIQGGFEACTWGMRLCAGGQVEYDTGLKAGGQGLTATGGTGTLSLDLMRFWDEPNRAVIERWADREIETLANKAVDLPNLTDRETLDYIAGLPESRWDFAIPPSRFQNSLLSSENEAMVAILKTDPQVLMFGEVHHPEHYPGTPTLTIFTQKILPALQGRYGHLVSEYIPYDLPREELDFFAETGTVSDGKTPQLARFLGLIPQGYRKDVVGLMETCRKLKIKLHGGGFSVLSFGSGAQVDRVNEITEATKLRIRTLAEKGEKVISYNGAAHNNIAGEIGDFPDMERVAFGDDIAGEFSAVEIDLVSPRILAGHLDGDALRESIDGPGLLREYARFVPEEGKISLVARAPSRFAMVYPFETWEKPPKP